MVSFTMSDKSIVDQIKHYQRDIIKSPENAKRMIRCIERLMVLPVTIAHLQETGVGRSVNELRKCGGEVGAAANALVCKWKSMVQAEEDSDVESEVEEDESKDTNHVSSPDNRDRPSSVNESVDKRKTDPDNRDRPSSVNESVDRRKTDSVDKYKKVNRNEEHKKPKSDHSSKKSESSNSENRHKSSDKKSLDKEDYKAHRSKSSKSEHNSGSDSRHSSSQRYKSDHNSRSNTKSNSSHRSDSECNGDIKTERHYSKSKHDENKISKHNSSENKSKDVKQKTGKDKHRREESSRKSEKDKQRKDESSHKSASNSSSKKYDVRKIESESSDDDEVYKPKSKKRKKSVSDDENKSESRGRRRSDSEEDEKYQNGKYSGQSAHRGFIKQESSDDSDTGTRNGSEVEENSRPSSRNSGSQIEFHNEEGISNRSSPNNYSDNEAESDSRRSSTQDDENEDGHSDNASDSDESEASSKMEVYVPTKIKREKESPPRHHKTSGDKNKSSHSRSNSHSSSSHSLSSHSKTGKLSSKTEGFENVKIKKEKNERENSKKHREDKTNDKKNHSTHSSSSTKESNKTEKKVKVKIEKQDDGSIDCESGASFADALMGLSEPKKKSAKRKSTPSTPEKQSKPIEERSKSKSEPRIPSSPSSSSKTGFKEPDLLSKNIKLEPLDVDLKSTLPEISPHYKPLPHYSPPSSPPGKRTKLLSQEEALSTIMSTKNQRTKVYSGNKSGYLKVPSLFDLCIQVLRDNIEALEYTGGVPYDLLKPVLDRATAAQLFQLEHYNPYLVEDTDNLWKFHCNKDFRGKEPDEFESWRELYVRLLDERERKLEALKANITQSMAKNTPVRQTKLAYVDSVVKPPRNIAKKQMKFGTGKAVKHDLVSKAMVGAAGSSPAPAAVPVPPPPASSRSSQSNAFPIPNFLKKKKAPLMQKTLQLIKGNRFKR